MTTAFVETLRHGIRDIKVWGFLVLGSVFVLSLFYEYLWQSVYPAAPREIACMEDPGGAMDIAQASDPAIARQYIRKADNRLSLGFSRSALWIRLDLSQAPEDWVLSVAAPWMDRIDLYVPAGENGWEKLSTGLQQPPSQVAPGRFTLKPSGQPPRSGMGYLRLESTLALNAGLEFRPEAAFQRHIRTMAYVYGGLLGMMVTLLIVNTMVFLQLRDKAYGVYTLYLLGIILHQICLQGQILFLPVRLWPHVPMISLSVSAFVLFFGALFCRYFLNTASHAPAIDRIITGGQAAAAGLLVLALTGKIWAGTWVAHVLAVFGPVFAIAAGVQALRRRYDPAAFYLLAWTVMLLSTMAWGAWSLGWLDRFRPPLMTLAVAAALESCLLTLALAERMRRVYTERQQLAKREKQYLQLSITDELTRLFNHRHFWDQLSREINRALDSGRPLSLVLMDLDDFKAVNDTHGHDVGDRMLNRVGALLRNNLRPEDTAYRYGGEEFTLILPGVDCQAAMEIADRIRKALASLLFRFESTPTLTITASFGAAGFIPGDTANILFKRADKYMYQAKTRGKNKVVYQKTAA